MAYLIGLISVEINIFSNNFKISLAKIPVNNASKANINRLKCIEKEGLENKDLDDNSFDKITADENDFINPRWSTDSYKGSLSKLLYFLSKLFFFKKYIPYYKYLSKKIIFFKGKYYDSKISSKLKKYFK